MRLAYILAVLVVVLSASCAADFSDETTTSADYLVDKEDINRTLYRQVPHFRLPHQCNMLTKKKTLGKPAQNRRTKRSNRIATGL